MQLALESIVTDGVDRRLDVYAGYSWGMPTGPLDDYITGVTVAPRWYERAAREPRVRGANLERYSARPAEPWELEELDNGLEELDAGLDVMLDNGAFPAYQRGDDLDLSTQLDDLHRGVELFPSAAWVIAPDVVAQPRTSWARTVASLTELESYGLHRVLLPYQNGMDVDALAGLALETGGGVFVGGTPGAFKRQAVRELEGRGVYVHVGRMSSDSQLSFCARHGVDSIDSTSFLRRNWSNRARLQNFRQAFERYARRRSGALDDQPARRNFAPARPCPYSYQ